MPTPIDVIRNLLRILPERPNNPITIDFKDNPLDEMEAPSDTLNGDADGSFCDDVQRLPSKITLNVGAVQADSTSSPAAPVGGELSLDLSLS